jgi:hypothetical protein
MVLAARVTRLILAIRVLGEKETYRAVGRLDGPAYLQTETAESQQEEEPAALGFLCLLLALPVVVVIFVVRRQRLLEQRVGFARHPSA